MTLPWSKHGFDSRIPLCVQTVAVGPIPIEESPGIPYPERGMYS